MQTERIQSRIETYTSNLTQAVQGGGGAQFSLLLSMISANQDLFDLAPVPGERGHFELPTAELRYPNPNEFYNGEVTKRLNTSVHEALRGDFAYINSYIETGARTPTNVSTNSDVFEKVALMSVGNLMLDEINTSRTLIGVA